VAAPLIIKEIYALFGSKENNFRIFAPSIKSYNET
jgi:hypothetical protein